MRATKKPAAYTISFIRLSNLKMIESNENTNNVPEISRKVFSLFSSVFVLFIAITSTSCTDDPLDTLLPFPELKMIPIKKRQP